MSVGIFKAAWISVYTEINVFLSDTLWNFVPIDLHLRFLIDLSSGAAYQCF